MRVKVGIRKSVIVIYCLLILGGINETVMAGKLYIKPELERKRVARLLEEADSDFRTAKVHMTLSPETALTEFQLARDKFKAAIEIIQDYGEGYYTPGDVEDFEKRIRECEMWINKCEIEARNNKTG